jgi:hypothetical protein
MVCLYAPKLVMHFVRAPVPVGSSGSHANTFFCIRAMNSPCVFALRLLSGFTTVGLCPNRFSIIPFVFMTELLMTELSSVDVTPDCIMGEMRYVPQQPPCPRIALPFIGVRGNDLDSDVCPTYPWLRYPPFNENPFFEFTLELLYFAAVFRLRVAIDMYVYILLAYFFDIESFTGRFEIIIFFAYNNFYVKVVDNYVILHGECVFVFVVNLEIVSNCCFLKLFNVL